MGKVIVVQFVTVDGVVEDPDGSGGMVGGGWAFRAGPEVFAGDKFDVGESMSSGVMLFGRRTWEMFSTRWPNRTGEFPDLMNGSRKVVATTTLDDVSAWTNSSIIDGGLEAAVASLAAAGDVVVIGSTSLVHALAAADLVDEYRLLVVPIVVGGGERLFPAGTTADLALVSAEAQGEMVAIRYERRR